MVLKLHYGSKNYPEVFKYIDFRALSSGAYDSVSRVTEIVLPIKSPGSMTADCLRTIP